MFSILLTITSFCSGASVTAAGGLARAQNSSPLPSYYDEQLGLTLRENFTGLSTNVTAVRQCASEGNGPAYLLNGLSDRGYWYQVGIASNWGYPGQQPLPGFGALYAVFAPNGAEVFPPTGNVIWKSLQIAQGDIVSLKLTLSGGNAVMQVFDSTSGSSNSTSYTAAGATRFVGSPTWTTSYFTGPMTEEYHSSPYYGDERSVNYAWNGLAPTSGWNWIGEFNTTSNKLLFYSQSLVNYTGQPQLQYLRSNGTVIASNPQFFVTGSLSTGQDCPTTPNPPPATPAPSQTFTFLVLTIAITTMLIATATIVGLKIRHKKPSAESSGSSSGPTT